MWSAKFPFICFHFFKYFLLCFCQFDSETVIGRFIGSTAGIGAPLGKQQKNTTCESTHHYIGFGVTKPLGANNTI